MLVFLAAGGKALAQSFLNLDFEVVENGMAKGWRGGGDGFKFTLDTTGGYINPKTVCIEKTGSGKFGTVASRFPVEDVKGKKLVFSGFIKTEKVERGYAGLRLRVDGGEKTTLFMDNMAGRGITGTTDWTYVMIVVAVDPNAVNIGYGMLLTGEGKAGFNGLQIDVNDKPYKEGPPPKGIKKPE